MPTCEEKKKSKVREILDQMQGMLEEYGGDGADSVELVRRVRRHWEYEDEK